MFKKGQSYEGETMPDQIRKESISDYLPLIAPALLALIIFYFMFYLDLVARVDAANGRQDIISSRITALNDSKASLTQFDGNFTLLKGNMSEYSENLTFFETKLTDFLGRLLTAETNSSSMASSIASINQKLTGQDVVIASVLDNMTVLHGRMNQIGNMTVANYTEMRNWATSLDINMTALNNSVTNIINRQNVLEDRIDALNDTMQKLCAYNSSWC
jgi:uncharacterized coiled-coil protein SlyX